MPPNPTVNYTGLATPIRGDVDRTITSLSGSSQSLVLAPQYRNRKRLIFKNGAAAAAINLNGGTAAIGGAGCMTLQPYEPFALFGADCPQTAVTVIGTSTNYISCYEGF